MSNIPISLTMRVGGPEPENPIAIYNQAVGFYLAGHRCLLVIPTDPKTNQSLPLQGVVNFVFSIELFLKSILVKNGIEKKNTHKIKELVGSCPPDLVEKISKEYSSTIQSPNFDEIITLTNDMFVKVRYQYEYNVHGLSDSAVIALATTLYTVCEDLLKSSSSN
jgi:hypothetical protein